MRIAIPVWNGIISPVLDTARLLSIYKCVAGKTDVIETCPLPADPAGKIDCLVQNADVLICGAISHNLERELYEHNIEVHPWVMGNDSEIVNAYVKGMIGEFEYSMPGCRRGRGCGGMRGHGCRHRRRLQ